MCRSRMMMYFLVHFRKQSRHVFTTNFHSCCYWRARLPVFSSSRLDDDCPNRIVWSVRRRQTDVCPWSVALSLSLFSRARKPNVRPFSSQSSSTQKHSPREFDTFPPRCRQLTTTLGCCRVCCCCRVSDLSSSYSFHLIIYCFFFHHSLYSYRPHLQTVGFHPIARAVIGCQCHVHNFVVIITKHYVNETC
jgi:hypothetical protein